MTNTSKTIIFFGTDTFSGVSLQQLIDAGYPIGAVVTKPDSKKGRGRELQKPIVKQIAEAHDILVLQPTKVTEIISDIEAITATTGQSPVGVLVSYGKIIPQQVIDLFTPGIINVHPSLLPLYRGPSPIESAILNGDDTTGVSIMQLSAAMDAGPVYSQTTAALSGTETLPELEKTLAEDGAKELIRILPDIINGSLVPTPQDDSKAVYCALLKKEDGVLDPSKIGAQQAERRIRAFLTFPKTRITIGSHSIIITKAHVGDGTTSPLDIECADGEFLCIDELISPSGKTMTSNAFINGYLR